MNTKTIKTVTTLGLALLISAGGITPTLLPLIASSDEASIEREIVERNKRIQDLEREIAEHRSQADRASREAQNLQNAVANLDASRSALEAERSLAELRLSNVQSTLAHLESEIRQTQRRMATSRALLEESIRHLDSASRTPLILTFFSHDTVSELWHDIAAMQQFQDSLSLQIRELASLSEQFDRQKRDQERKRTELNNLRDEIREQEQAVIYTIAERERLLERTQNEESEYRRIVQQKQAQKEAFERELFEFESQLRYDIDPTQVPSARPGLLSWPLNNVYVTQPFGRTVASQRLYVSGTHNGVDFRAGVGTPTYATHSGVVVGTGNTDRIPGCYSYGKWILIDHGNGLSSIYAHLSVKSVSEGSTVTRGQVVGYTGNTGYSTGPHLHYGLYASQGVQIQQYTSSINCQQAYIPLADRRAYLDPMQYLPPYR